MIPLVLVGGQNVAAVIKWQLLNQPSHNIIHHGKVFWPLFNSISPQ